MNHSHSHPHDNTAGFKTAFWLNFGFTLLEISGGLWTNSIAIVADAVHDLGDSLSLGLAWFLDRYAQKSQDDEYSYGYRRYSLLGALLNTVVLIIGGLIVLSEAVPRIITPEPTNAPGMIGLALVGILVNGLAVLRVKQGQSLNARVVAWHLLEDVLGWVAVLIVSITLLFSDLYILDPILSILITLYILYNVIKNLEQTLAIFLQAVPKEIDLNKIKAKILTIDRVKSTHHTHVWSLDGEHHVLTTHVVVADEASKEEILQVKRDVIATTQGMGSFQSKIIYKSIDRYSQGGIMIKAKEAQVDELQARLDSWKARIETLKAEAEQAQVEAEPSFADISETFHAIHDRAKAKIQAFDQANGEAAEILLEGIENAFEELEQAFKEAVSKFKQTTNNG